MVKKLGPLFNVSSHIYFSYMSLRRQIFCEDAVIWCKETEERIGFPRDLSEGPQKAKVGQKLSKSKYF